MKNKVVFILTIIAATFLSINASSQDRVKSLVGVKSSVNLSKQFSYSSYGLGFESGLFWQHRLSKLIDLRLGLEFFMINTPSTGGITIGISPISSEYSLRGIEAPIELLISIDGKENKKVNWFWNLGFAPGYLVELKSTNRLYNGDVEVSKHNFGKRYYNYAPSMNLECRTAIGDRYNAHLSGGLTLSKAWHGFNGYTVWNMSMILSRNIKAKTKDQKV